MKKKWLVTMIAPMLALTLITGCGTSNDKNEPVDEGPIDREIEDRDREIENNDMDENIEDNDLRDQDERDDDLTNDRTDEIEREDTR